MTCDYCGCELHDPERGARTGLIGIVIEREGRKCGDPPASLCVRCGAVDAPAEPPPERKRR